MRGGQGMPGAAPGVTPSVPGPYPPGVTPSIPGPNPPGVTPSVPGPGGRPQARINGLCPPRMTACRRKSCGFRTATRPEVPGRIRQCRPREIRRRPQIPGQRHGFRRPYHYRERPDRLETQDPAAAIRGQLQDVGRGSAEWRDRPLAEAGRLSTR